MKIRLTCATCNILQIKNLVRGADWPIRIESRGWNLVASFAITLMTIWLHSSLELYWITIWHPTSYTLDQDSINYDVVPFFSSTQTWNDGYIWKQCTKYGRIYFRSVSCEKICYFAIVMLNGRPLFQLQQVSILFYLWFKGRNRINITKTSHIKLNNNNNICCSKCLNWNSAIREPKQLYVCKFH